MSTHLHLRFNSQTVNAIGCFASRNNRIEIVVSAAAATSTSRIRDIPLSHKQKCILREFGSSLSPLRASQGRKCLNGKCFKYSPSLVCCVSFPKKKMNVGSQVDLSFFIKNIIPLLGLESFKMEK